jgi:hypothetical protein
MKLTDKRKMQTKTIDRTSATESQRCTVIMLQTPKILKVLQTICCTLLKGHPTHIVLYYAEKEVCCGLVKK